MLKYVADRLVQSVLTLLLLSLLVFLLARVLGNPLQYLMELEASSEQIERMTKMLGLDRPLWEQYADFLWHLAKGDLGTSVRQQTPVLEVIAGRFGNTIGLVLLATVFAVVVSVVLGTLAAIYRGGALDWVARTVAAVGQSAPSFWVGIVLIQVMSVQFELLPSAGMGSFVNYLMPAFTLGLLGVASMTRLLRSSMIEVLSSEYVKRARLMGVSELNIVLRHGLRNGCLPVLTYAGEYIGHLVTAAVVVEVVFAWPGMGRLAFEAVFTRDYPLIQGVVMVMAVIVMALNLVVDLLYALIDPRIRHARS